MQSPQLLDLPPASPDYLKSRKFGSLSLLCLLSIPCLLFPSPLFSFLLLFLSCQLPHYFLIFSYMFVPCLLLSIDLVSQAGYTPWAWAALFDAAATAQRMEDWNSNGSNGAFRDFHGDAKEKRGASNCGKTMS